MQKGNGKQAQRERLERLKMQRDKLNRRIQKVENLGKVKRRKEETRIKILVGAFYLEQARKEGKLEALREKMLGFLKRESDRLLFITL